jgi:hypothetical protein
MAENKKEMGAERDPEVEEMYHSIANGHTSDVDNGNGNAIDSKDMYRMGKEQQFRVSREPDVRSTSTNACSEFSGYRR